VLTLALLRRLRLARRPTGQIALAWGALYPNYTFLPGVDIRIEGQGRLPPPPVLFAMNHSDRYNYWPFQYALYRRCNRLTATWVKGKYYEHPWLARFMSWTNNIPTASLGYLITKDHLRATGQRPNDAEYRRLRALVDTGAADPGVGSARDMFGRYFDPAREPYAAAVGCVFAEMMQHFTRLNGQCFAEGIDLIVFPEGTRSATLGPGHTGIAQIALRFGATIVPVGCNGSDLVYPGNSPWARRGSITYRIGAPLAPAKLDAFDPFTSAADLHAPKFEALTTEVMGRIALLLDERHKPLAEPRRAVGAARFV
jgi:1-acyl-sn-glycerol-3-phosphate acyltransferase